MAAAKVSKEVLSPLSEYMSRHFQHHLLDWILSLFFFFPAMLCYWRGIWDLYSYYVFRDQDPLRAWTIAGIGSGFIMAYFVYPLVNWFIRDLPPVLRNIIVRLTLYCGGIPAMGYWRGVWGVADYYLGLGWKNGAIGLAVCYPLLVLLGASRNVIFPPFVVSRDNREGALLPCTRFQVRVGKSCGRILLYILDSLFTHFVIVTLTIMSWRSMLTMIATIPYPNEMGDPICFGVGIIAVVILYALEIPLALLGRALAFCSEPENTEVREEACRNRTFRDDDDRLSQDIQDRECNFVHNSENNRQGVVPRQPVNQQLAIQFPDELASQRSSIQNQPLPFQPPSVSRPVYHSSTLNLPFNESGIQTPVEAERSEKPSSVLQRLRLSRQAMTGFRLRIYENAIFFIVFVSEGFLWLGAWNLNSTYIIPDLLVGGWVNHAFGAVLLIGLGLMTYGGFCGCASDESLLATLIDFTPQNSFYFYPIRYVREIVEQTIIESRNSTGSQSPDSPDQPQTPTAAAAISASTSTINSNEAASSVVPEFITHV